MPCQSEAMEVGDISQDLDQAEENDLVEGVYIYLTEGQYPVNCAANRKRIIMRKVEKFRVRNVELFYIKKKSRKVNLDLNSQHLFLIQLHIYTYIIDSTSHYIVGNSTYKFET